MKEPRLRLKEFVDNWKVIKLSEIARRVTRKNSNLESTLPLTISAAEGLISQISFFNNIVASSNLSGYYLIKKGEFAYNKSSSAGHPFGSIKRLNKYEEGALSTLYIVFNISGDVSSDYVTYFFDTSLWYKEVSMRAFEGARNHGLLNIGANDFLDINISLPADKREQQAIADSFKSLDSIITLTSKKIEMLKQTLTSCMQTMFPQEGELEPKVRFKGFEGEWNEDKASNIFSAFNEKNRPDLPVLSANQDVRGMAPRSETGYQISHDKRNEVGYKHVLPGQFVMHLRSFQGGFAHASLEGITSPAYIVFGLKDTSVHYNMYWKYVFMSEEFVHRLRAITYGIRDGRSISFDEFTKMNFVFPSYDEQKKIADYITTLYEVVALQTKRLDLLKHIKSACLDNMFI